MAGIGFRLNRFFDEDNNTAKLQGTLYSIIISSGPWLMTVLSIGALSFFAQKKLWSLDLAVFRSIISYSYALSLIVFGAVEMPFTRYLADKIFISDTSSFKSLYSYSLAVAIFVGSIISYVFYSFFDFSYTLIFINTILLISIFTIWFAMVFLSAAKKYTFIVFSFLLGGIVSIILGKILGEQYELIGYVGGFCIGEVFIAVLLSCLLFVEFNGNDFPSLEIIEYFDDYKSLSLIGLFYYLGTWVDKFVVWFSPWGENITGLFYTSKYYDTSIFLSYLTIVPSLAYFLVQVETQFYKKYTLYYQSIDYKANLFELDDYISQIITSLRIQTGRLIKVQTFITLFVWYFADEIIDALYLAPMHSVMFKYGAIGAYLQVFFLICNIILLYFGSYKKVLINYSVFLVSNGLLSAYFTQFGYEYFGMGYCISCLITLVISVIAIDRTTEKLNFNTFMGQPL